MTDNLDVKGESIRASRVTGTAVYGADREKIGTVEDFVVGKRDGQVRYAILGVGGFLGMGEDHHTLPWDQLDYDTDLGGYRVTVTKDQLQNAPTNARGTEPDYSRVDTYYSSL